MGYSYKPNISGTNVTLNDEYDIERSVCETAVLDFWRACTMKILLKYYRKSEHFSA